MKASNSILKDEIETEKKICLKNNKQTKDRILELQKEGILYARKIEEESKRLVTHVLTQSELKSTIEEYEAKIKEKKDELRNLEGNKASAYR